MSSVTPPEMKRKVANATKSPVEGSKRSEVRVRTNAVMATSVIAPVTTFLIADLLKA